jgi:hypothetical protein
MSRIEGTGFGRLLRRLRTDVGTRARAPASDATASRTVQGKPRAGAPRAGLRVELAARLASIDPLREDADTRALEAFIECVLVREFGASLMASASGQDLLGQVRTALLASPQAREALMEMLTTLAAPRDRQG